VPHLTPFEILENAETKPTPPNNHYGYDNILISHSVSNDNLDNFDNNFNDKQVRK